MVIASLSLLINYYLLKSTVLKHSLQKLVMSYTTVNLHFCHFPGSNHWYHITCNSFSIHIHNKRLSLYWTTPGMMVIAANQYASDQCQWDAVFLTLVQQRTSPNPTALPLPLLLCTLRSATVPPFNTSTTCTHD